MAVALIVVYSLFAVVALVNLALMRRPGRRADGPKIAVLIPARDEEQNLRALLPLLDGVKVYVFDDESSDGTAEVAAALGATVISAREPLPKGWTGKNRACDQLAKAAAEDSDADWYLFLDADVRPKAGFLDAMRDLAATTGRNKVISGIPQIQAGRGAEPLFLAWVGWIILATNPFGLVSRTGKGHNRFTNGQIHMWRATTYTGLWPNEKVKGQIMEDVMIGRLLAREGVPVEVANLSRVLSVRMYETWRETLDGMSKNSFEITGSVVGSVLVALMLLVLAWAWVLAPVCLIVLTLSGLFVAIQAKSVWWPALLMPLVLMIAAFTVLRSTVWHRRGRVVWKGRTYGSGDSSKPTGGC